eukprot:scaffold2843_cov90-Isochrysis_galbana.AAC.2
MHALPPVVPGDDDLELGLVQRHQAEGEPGEEGRARDEQQKQRVVPAGRRGRVGCQRDGRGACSNPDHASQLIHK